MIRVFETAQFTADIDTGNQKLVVSAGQVGIATYPVEIDLATQSVIDTPRENLISMAEYLDAQDGDSNFRNWDQKTLEAYVVSSWEDYILPREDTENDAEYVLRIWYASEHPPKSVDCFATDMGGQISENETIISDEWDVVEMPDGSILTNTDTDESAWKDVAEVQSAIRENAVYL